MTAVATSRSAAGFLPNGSCHTHWTSRVYGPQGDCCWILCICSFSFFIYYLHQEIVPFFFLKTLSYSWHYWKNFVSFVNDQLLHISKPDSLPLTLLPTMPSTYSNRPAAVFWVLFPHLGLQSREVAACRAWQHPAGIRERGAGHMAGADSVYLWLALHSQPSPSLVHVCVVASHTAV